MSQTGVQLGLELGLTLERGMVINWPIHCLQILWWWSSPLQQHHARHPQRQYTDRGCPVGKHSRGRGKKNGKCTMNTIEIC